MDSEAKSPTNRYMMGVQGDQCEQHNSALICKISNQFDNHQVKCSNSILQNKTDFNKLAKVCNYAQDTANYGETTFYAESPSHALIFSNEEIKGKSASGIATPLHYKDSHHACLLINKIELKELSIGGRPKILNIRTDVLKVTQESKDNYVRRLNVVPSKMVFPKIRSKEEIQSLDFAKKLEAYDKGINKHFFIILITISCLLPVSLLLCLIICLVMKKKEAGQPPQPPSSA